MINEKNTYNNSNDVIISVKNIEKCDTKYENNTVKNVKRKMKSKILSIISKYI